MFKISLVIQVHFAQRLYQSVQHSKIGIVLFFILFAWNMAVTAQKNYYLNTNSIENSNVRIGADSTCKPVTVKKKKFGYSCDDTIIIRDKCWCDHKFESQGYLFSDLVGIDYNQPNGLVQTNVYLSYTRPVRQYPSPLSIWEQMFSNKKDKDSIRRVRDPNYRPIKFYLFRNIVLFDITLTKIVNQNRELQTRYLLDSDIRYFNRFDLLQYANVISATKLNIITVRWNGIANCYIDFMPMFYNTTISDSLHKDKKTNIPTIAFGGNIKLKTEKQILDKFSAEIAFSVYVPRLYSDLYNDHGRNQLKAYQENLGLENLNDYPRTIQAIDIRLEYEQKEKINAFFRFAIYHNVFDSYFKEDKPKNVFAQMQVGVNYNLAKLFESKSNAKE